MESCMILHDALSCLCIGKVLVLPKTVGFSLLLCFLDMASVTTIVILAMLIEMKPALWNEPAPSAPLNIGI